MVLFSGHISSWKHPLHPKVNIGDSYCMITVLIQAGVLFVLLAWIGKEGITVVLTNSPWVKNSQI